MYCTPKIGSMSHMSSHKKMTRIDFVPVVPVVPVVPLPTLCWDHLSSSFERAPHGLFQGCQHHGIYGITFPKHPKASQSIRKLYLDDTRILQLEILWHSAWNILKSVEIHPIYWIYWHGATPECFSGAQRQFLDTPCPPQRWNGARHRFMWLLSVSVGPFSLETCISKLDLQTLEEYIKMSWKRFNLCSLFISLPQGCTRENYWGKPKDTQNVTCTLPYYPILPWEALKKLKNPCMSNSMVNFGIVRDWNQIDWWK